MRIALLVILSAVGTVGAFGQDRPTFKGAIDLVALNVVVMNRQQQFVSDLTAGNFAVYEDGVQQDVSFFAADELPLDLAILIDTSASMLYKLPTAQKAAVGFISALGPTDRVLVVDVKDTTGIAAPLSEDLKAAKTAILATTPSGGTALYNAIYMTLKELVKRRDETDMRRQAVVLLSDGEDTRSVVAYDDVMDLAKRSGVSIYSIMLGSSLPTDRDLGLRRWNPNVTKSEYGMKALAQETGGRSFFAADIGDLDGVYKSIGQELANQYALGYTSKNQRRDGGYRRVTVRIVDRADAQPRTRAGYYAPRG